MRDQGRRRPIRIGKRAANALLALVLVGPAPGPTPLTGEPSLPGPASRPAALQTPGSVQILLPGDEYQQGELPPNSGGTWWVLHGPADATVLEPLTVSVSTTDGCGADDPGAPAGRAVTVRDARDAFLLLRGLPSPAEGPIRTAFLDDGASGEAERTEVPWDSLQVVVRRSTEPPTQDRTGHYRIFMSVGSREMVLRSAEWQGEGDWRVRWIGDLNRDGWPDLLVDASYKYSVHTTRLYLSRVGGAGEVGMIEAGTVQHFAC